ncbi:MAG: 2-amino-4-hydroxy-6-hydroxymethyldihydropteridine diphosphokinase [Sinomicrobium sp.]|nr:2-amino-4-hydroxy-6-hydroxymethyldihydropteridine diphosphokinase [Sinomicrobium sp.]
MKSLRRIYLSLGSNMGDKMKNLQTAVDQLRRDVGKITGCSAVYRSASWGFKGDDFLNACLAVDTALSSGAVMDMIRDIETGMGRVRNGGDGYTSRSIDIDMLFYEDEVCTVPGMTLPHPRLHLRRFVLEPLAAIAPGKIHPALRRSVTQLLDECPDKSVLSKTNHRLDIKNKNDFSGFDFITIEGNIGAGKTTLTTKIAADFNGKPVLERFADNPFLPKFYEDRHRYAFPLEMSFLADRYQQFTDDTAQPDLFKNFMVSDYNIYKSLIFARITLPEEEFKLYRKLFNFMYKEVKKPDVYVYLHQETGTLLENIKKRGRDYEQNIPGSYLEKINKGYLEFIKTHTDLRTLVIDTSNLDFVKRREDYEFIIDKIHNFNN